MLIQNLEVIYTVSEEGIAIKTKDYARCASQGTSISEAIHNTGEAFVDYIQVENKLKDTATKVSDDLNIISKQVSNENF